jgi:hypothetical protein
MFDPPHFTKEGFGNLGIINSAAILVARTENHLTCQGNTEIFTS